MLLVSALAVDVRSVDMFVCRGVHSVALVCIAIGEVSMQDV